MNWGDYLALEIWFFCQLGYKLHNWNQHYNFLWKLLIKLPSSEFNRTFIFTSCLTLNPIFAPTCYFFFFLIPFYLSFLNLKTKSINEKYKPTFSGWKLKDHFKDNSQIILIVNCFTSHCKLFLLLFIYSKILINLDWMQI